MSNTNPLLTPHQMGALHLPNRVLMAAMTRNRADEGAVPAELAITYYRQRASAGLVFTEASQVHPTGTGYIGTPGCYNEAQTEAWRKIVEAVHAAGGRIFLQLWHVGRVSDPELQPDGGQPIAPSAIQGDGFVFAPSGFKPMAEPRAMTQADIDEMIAAFRRGAENAKAAGFDGVEIHGANGYLLDQFLRDGTNQRTDQYGGSLENRIRFPMQVIEAVLDVWGEERVGYRISPAGRFNDMSDSDEAGTFGHFAEQLAKLPLAYLHVVEPGQMDPNEAAQVPAALSDTTSFFRERYAGTLIVNAGYDHERGMQVVAENKADLVAYGRPFLANPDLPERFRRNAPLNEPDPDSFYGGDHRGYTDYPFLEESTTVPTA